MAQFWQTGLRRLTIRTVSCWLAVLLLAVSVSVGGPQNSWAVQPDEILADQKLEARARVLSAELRCLVCQNQSIDDSDAPLARDLRLLVRERLKEGDTNSQVLDFVVQRYGEFVLLKPPFGMHTLILWLGPVFVLLGAIWLARTTILSRRTTVEATTTGTGLSEAEQSRLDALVNERDG
ncbi:MAG: cytochrome c-type biogenesis protein [Pseudomonadota bacterium]